MKQQETRKQALIRLTATYKSTDNATKRSVLRDMIERNYMIVYGW